MNAGIIQVDENLRIVDFVEKSEQPCSMPGNREMAIISTASIVCNTDFLLELLDKDAKLETLNHDFGRDIIPAAIREQTVYAFPFADLEYLDKPGYWRDVGAEDSYWKAISNSPTSYGNSTSTVRTGRYRPTSHSFRPESSCSTNSPTAAAPWIHWSVVAASSRVRRCVGASVRPVLGRTH